MRTTSPWEHEVTTSESSTHYLRQRTVKYMTWYMYCKVKLWTLDEVLSFWVWHEMVPLLLTAKIMLMSMSLLGYWLRDGVCAMTACSKANHRVHSGLNFSTTKEMYFHNYGLICIERKTFSWCIKNMKRFKCTIFEKCNPVVKTSSKMD